MAEQRYRRLTRARLRSEGRLLTVSSAHSSLWLGEDHLLVIDSSGVAEEYRRFYFRDIQAITLVQTKRRLIWNCVLGFFVALCLFGWGYDFASDQEISPGSLVAGVIITSIFALPLLINNLLGPTCDCWIQTAVQTVSLPSLSRVGRVHGVLERIRPLIAAAQGELTPDDIERGFTDPGWQAGDRAVPPPPLRSLKGTAHLVLFWLMVLDLPIVLMDFVAPGDLLDGLAMFLIFATNVCAVTAIVQQHRAVAPVMLKRIPWIVIGTSAVLLFLSMVYAGILAAGNGTGLEDPYSDPVVLVMTIVSTAILVGFGVAGLLALRRHREATRQSVSSNPPLPV